MKKKKKKKKLSTYLVVNSMDPDQSDTLSDLIQVQTIYHLISCLVRVSMKHVFFATFTGKAVRRRGVTFMST